MNEELQNEEPASPAIASDHPQSDQGKCLDDLQDLLHSLTHPGLGNKPWAVQLRAGVREALVQVQIIRMANHLGRPPNEALVAAQDLLVPIRQAKVLASKSRCDNLTKVSLKFALLLGERLVRHQKALSSVEGD